MVPSKNCGQFIPLFLMRAREFFEPANPLHNKLADLNVLRKRKRGAYVSRGLESRVLHFSSNLTSL